jgi:transcriptional regulator with XRE-family HTH domain
MYLEMNGARVRELREEKGLSKRGLADVASISMSTARRGEGEDLSNVLYRAGPLLAPVTSISTKDNVKTCLQYQEKNGTPG